MNTILSFNKLTVLSKTYKKYFSEEFNQKGVTIISGQNTSGKTTLLQSIYYTLGINDIKKYLFPLLKNNDLIFYLNCSLSKDNNREDISFIRSNNKIYILRKTGMKIFYNIDSDNTDSHRNLKDYFAETFNYSLQLDKQGDFVQAPIEGIFLPYYISQDRGWVYLRKSIGNFEYYKNFREDYLDYYLGISDIDDKKRRVELNKRKIECISKKNIIEKINNSNRMQVSLLDTEEYSHKAKEYIEDYASNKIELKKLETTLYVKGNEEALAIKRSELLKKVKQGLRLQLSESTCPTCRRKYDRTFEEIYSLLQNVADTDKEIELINTKIEQSKTKTPTIQKKITNNLKQLHAKYEILSEYRQSEISFKEWLKGKAYVEMKEINDSEIKKLESELKEIQDELKLLNSEDVIDQKRRDRVNYFRYLFKNSLQELEVQIDNEDIEDLYQISSFPFSGSELHKVVLGYNVSFNNLILHFNKKVHRCPFVLDSIFKEDLTEGGKHGTKELILKYISNNVPMDTQLFISIAQQDKIKNNPKVKNKIETYNEIYFNNQAKIIWINDLQKSFLNKEKDFDNVLKGIEDLISCNQ